MEPMGGWGDRNGLGWRQVEWFSFAGIPEIWGMADGVQIGLQEFVMF